MTLTANRGFAEWGDVFGDAVLQQHHWTDGAALYNSWAGASEPLDVMIRNYAMMENEMDADGFLTSAYTRISTK